MQEGIESIGEFVVSGSDAAELLEPIEETLNEVACLVAMPVDRAFDFPVVTRRDVGLSTTALDGFDERIAVVDLVRRDRFGRDPGNQGRAPGHIRHLTSGENQPKLDMYLELAT